MIIPVYMFAFSNDRNLIRPVNIPDEKGKFAKLEKLLNLVFHYGQNENCQLNIPSVSVGDVAEIENEYFMVLPIGWKKISKDVFDILSPPTSSYAYGISCTE